MLINVQLKQAGKKQNNIVTDCIYLKTKPDTVRDLLTGTVQFCLDNFHKNQEHSPAYSPEEIDRKASVGKVTFGFLYGNTEISLEAANTTTCQAFEDGLVALFIDGEQKEQLDDIIALTPDSIITFVKLTMLSGRLW